ncbi:hypothetical protein RRG08_064255 [Elysia crispata]|uniref:Uncharacterized protein n=1 Tax=Elysia crispata TaxID=231223 RepID=A0AAE1AD82_9GAST|nr:hypothetical protein RRG08_064255 [Elysia crispata]
MQKSLMRKTIERQADGEKYRAGKLGSSEMDKARESGTNSLPVFSFPQVSHKLQASTPPGHHQLTVTSPPDHHQLTVTSPPVTTNSL